jgi:hypothetical protein
MTSRSLRLDTATLWFEAPFVMALRIQQMQLAALTGKTQDAAELHRMVSEKMEATAESAIAVNMAMWRNALDNTMRLMTGGRALPGGAAVASAALKPYGKRVRSNARRLARKPG